MTAAPDLYVLDADQLRDELTRIRITHSVPTVDGVVHACIRHDLCTDEHSTAALFVGNDGSAVLALRGENWH